MIERNGDVFTTEATYIGHGVNCKGIMGAGIAKTIREKCPQVYQEYKAVCNSGLGLNPGEFFVYSENGKYIVNMATQDMPGPNAHYPWLFNVLYNFSKSARNPEKLKKYGNICAIPELGCGIGGLEWPGVKKVIETVEFVVPGIEYEVWHYGK